MHLLSVLGEIAVQQNQFALYYHYITFCTQARTVP